MWKQFTVSSILHNDPEVLEGKVLTLGIGVHHTLRLQRLHHESGTGTSGLLDAVRTFQGLHISRIQFGVKVPTCLK